MKVTVKKGSTIHTKEGKTHKEGEVLEVGEDISKEFFGFFIGSYISTCTEAAI